MADLYEFVPPQKVKVEMKIRIIFALTVNRLILIR